MGSKAKRDRIIDIARGIAIFSIIIGHFGIHTVVRVVFTYHVPIFFVIAGYLIKKENVYFLVKRKMCSLLIPYAITCMTVVVLQSIAACARDNDIIETFWYWLKAGFYGAGGTYNLPGSFSAIGAVWFLLAMFWGSLLMQLVLRFPSYLQIPIAVALFLLGYVSAHKLIWLPFDVQPGCCSVLYIYVGYLAKHFENHIEKLGKKVWPGAFLVWAFFIYNFTTFYLVSCDYGRGIIDIAASLCACYCIFFIAYRLERLGGWIVDALAFFGQYSLIVLCVHLIEMNLVDWWAVVSWLEIIGFPHLTGCLLSATIKMIVIIGITLIIVLGKNKVQLIGGNKDHDQKKSGLSKSCKCDF